MTDRLKTKEWSRQRIKALNRDKCKCRRCGAEESLDIHHVVPFRKVRHNNLWNLVTLCGNCHKEMENRYERVGLTQTMMGWIDKNCEALG